jgi:Protein of unknown function (DUF3592)
VELVPVIFVVVGFGIVFASARGLARASRFERTAQRTRGLVTSVRWKHASATSSSSSSRVAYPVLRFELPDGRTVEVESTFGSNPPPAREGDTVNVLYDPADPTDARQEGFLGSGRVAAIVGLVIGIAFVVMGSLITGVFYLARDML